MTNFVVTYAPSIALFALVLALLALAWALILQLRLRRLQQQYAVLTTGTAGGSLEAVLAEHMDNVRTAVEKAARAEEKVTQMEQASRGHVQHVAVVRYNPFDHTGGDQSFVVALADDHGDGAVINSMHARDGTRIYAKPLTAWQSKYPFTEEEENAIAAARSRREA